MTDTEFPTARVIWKARAIGQDINDPGGIPEGIPLAGERTLESVPERRR